jgi:hypothetical protein
MLTENVGNTPHSRAHRVFGLASVLALTSACASLAPLTGDAAVGLDALTSAEQPSAGDVPSQGSLASTLQGSSSLRVERVRVLARHVNVGAGLEIDNNGPDLSIAYRARTREDQRVTIDPVTLDPYTPLEPSELSLIGGFVPPTRQSQYTTLSDARVLHCFMRGNVDYGYRLFAEIEHGPRRVAVNGTPSNLFAADAAPVEITPGSSEVLGSIQVARVDDRHAVVAFYAANHDEIDVMVARVEAL